MKWSLEKRREAGEGGGVEVERERVVTTISR